MNSAAIARAALYVVFMGVGAATSGAATIMPCGPLAPSSDMPSYRANIAVDDVGLRFFLPDISEGRNIAKEFVPSFTALSTPNSHTPRIARSVGDTTLDLPMEGYQVGAHHISPVPLPSAAVLFGSGLISLIAIGRQKRASRRQVLGMATVGI